MNWLIMSVVPGASATSWAIHAVLKKCTNKILIYSNFLKLKTSPKNLRLSLKLNLKLSYKSGF